MKIAGIETALYRVPPKTVRFDSIQELSAFEMIPTRSPALSSRREIDASGNRLA